MTDLSGQTILQVIPDLSIGGAERTTLEVAEAIVAAGGRALVASRGGRLEGQLAKVGGELARMNAATKHPFSLWRNGHRLAGLIRREDVSIIHARSRAPAWSAYWAARKTGAHFITTYHGAYNARSGLKRKYNSVMARGDMVIANSAWIAAHVIAEHQVPAERVVAIPRGVDVGRFDPDAVSQDRIERVRGSFGFISADRFVALMPARLTRWKGQVEAIEAVAALPPADREQIVLVIAGDAQGRDSYLDMLRELAEKRGLSQQVRITGPLEDVPAGMMVADVVLCPSIEPEAFGRVAVEAQAMGVPVIASDHGGAQETVSDGETGFRVAPGDPQALSQALGRVMAMGHQARRAMGAVGREHVLQRFSIRNLQEATLKVYHSVLGGQSFEGAV